MPLRLHALALVRCLAASPCARRQPMQRPPLNPSPSSSIMRGRPWKVRPGHSRAGPWLPLPRTGAGAGAATPREHGRDADRAHRARRTPAGARPRTYEARQRVRVERWSRGSERASARPHGRARAAHVAAPSDPAKSGRARARGCHGADQRCHDH
jgi:hypothetical protein